MKRVYVLNSSALPVLGTLMYTFKKFLSGFSYYEYETHIVTDMEQIIDGSIVILSNHGMPQGMSYLNQLAENLPNCIYICWFYHSYYYDIPFKKFILTGENFRSEPQYTHLEDWKLQLKINNYVPLTFACALYPNDIGKHHRNEILNGCFCGSAYKPNWISGLVNIAYIPGACHGNIVNEEDRIKLFLSSKIAFGFHSNDNILNNVVVERVFEGLAYGCVVISDSPAAHNITNGIVQYASNKEEFLQIYRALLRNRPLISELQCKGYEWVKNNGLYVHTAKQFIDKIELFHS